MNKPTEEIRLDEGKPRDAKTIACHMREIIREIAAAADREGHRKTPARFENALKILTSGYH